MEKPVRSSFQYLGISYECALAIGNSLNLSEMLHEVVHTMVHKTNAHRGIIWVNNGEKKLQPAASAGINIEDVLAQGEIMDLRDVLTQIQKRRQFILRYKDDKDFLQYCPVITEKEESVLIVPVTNVAIIHLVYASREIADEPLANLLASLSKKLSVAIEACMTHGNVIKEIQVRVETEEKLRKKTEQLSSSQKELQGLYGESEQARKSLLSILEDVAQKEEALKESESKLSSILSSIDDLVFVFDQVDRFILIQNPTSKQLYTTPDIFIGKKPFEVMPSHLNKIFSDAFDKIKKGQVAEYDYWLNIDGKILWFSAKHSPRLIDGEFVGSVSVVRDITERKQAEEALKEAEIKYHTLVDNIPAVTYVAAIDETSTTLYVSPQIETILGVSPDTCKNDPDFWRKQLHPDDRERVLAEVTRSHNTNEPFILEYRMFSSDGSQVWLHDEAKTVKDDKENPRYIQGVMTDITERKQAEEELRLHAAMMDNVTEGVYLVGLDDLLIKWTNENFTRMFGYDPGGMVGKQVDIVNAPTERTPTETRISIVDVLNETGEWHGEVRNIKRDGTHFWCYANVSLFDHPEYGKVIMSVHTDITERMNAEEKLRRFNEMAVDRELKMVELKKEMNSLLRELGKEPRYKILEQLSIGAGR